MNEYSVLISMWIALCVISFANPAIAVLCVIFGGMTTIFCTLFSILKEGPNYE